MYLLQIQRIAGTIQKLDLLQKLIVQILPGKLFECRIINGVIRLGSSLGSAGCNRLEGADGFGVTVVNTLKTLTGADRPVDRTGADAQNCFDIIQKLKGILSIPV